MQLTQWTDYSLRVLLYCASRAETGTFATVSEVAAFFGISRHHLTKIVQDLANRGFLETVRGRGGGMRLLHPPAAVSVGAVVRATETDFRLVECFDAQTNHCRLSAQCQLSTVLDTALQRFLATLDAVSLADLLRNTGSMGHDAAHWRPLHPAPKRRARAPA